VSPRLATRGLANYQAGCCMTSELVTIHFLRLVIVGSQETGSQTASSTPSGITPLSRRHPFRSVEAIRKQSLGCNFLPTELSKIEPVSPSSFRFSASAFRLNLRGVSAPDQL